MACAAVALAAGCGGDDERAASGDVVWEKPPALTTPQTLPQDRILSGRIRNDSLRRLDLKAAEVAVIAEDGKALRSSAIFLSGFGRGLYPPNREPEQIFDFQLLRTGKIARLKPGQAIPLTVSWRERIGTRAARIEYRGGSLPVP